MRRKRGFSAFGEAVYIVDPNTGDLRNSTKKDVEDLTRLLDALDVIPVCERMAGAQDYPANCQTKVDTKNTPSSFIFSTVVL